MWLDDDQDKVAAWLRSKSEVCPDCGTRDDDWVDATGRYLDQPAWEAATVRCYGCRAIADAGDDVPAEEKGIRVVLRPLSPGDTPSRT